MKHPASRTLYACWQAAAPDTSLRQDGYHFVIAADAASRFALREAGVSLRALLPPGAEAQPFAKLFTPRSRSAVGDLLAIVADETLPTIAGVGARRGRRAVALELLMLPPRPEADAPALTGLLVPLTADCAGPVTGLTLTSWRHLHPPAPRALRKITVAPGVVLYEGRP